MALTFQWFITDKLLGHKAMYIIAKALNHKGHLLSEIRLIFKSYCAVLLRVCSTTMLVSLAVHKFKINITRRHSEV